MKKHYPIIPYKLTSPIWKITCLIWEIPYWTGFSWFSQVFNFVLVHLAILFNVNLIDNFIIYLYSPEITIDRLDYSDWVTGLHGPRLLNSGPVLFLILLAKMWEFGPGAPLG